MEDHEENHEETQFGAKEKNFKSGPKVNRGKGSNL